MPPDKRAVAGFKGRDETANALIRTGDPGDDPIVDDERSERAPIVLTFFLGRDRRLPE